MDPAELGLWLHVRNYPTEVKENREVLKNWLLSQETTILAVPTEEVGQRFLDFINSPDRLFDLMIKDLTDQNIEFDKDKVQAFFESKKTELALYARNPNPGNLLARAYILHAKRKFSKYTKKTDPRINRALKSHHEKVRVYDDVDTQESKYKSKKMGRVTLDNVNLGKTYIHVDSIFNNSSSLTSIVIPVNNKEQYSFDSKSTPYIIQNIKSVKVSNVFIPTPTNATLIEQDLIKMEISEFNNLAHREYPNRNFMFLFRVVSSVGDRFRLEALNDIYQFETYITVLNSLSFTFWYQNLKLTLPQVCFNGVADFGTDPLEITFNSHSLNTGDKISIYRWEGNPSTLNSSINSMHVVTVIDPNVFSIPISPGSVTGLYGNNIKYYVLKNKTDMLLDITCL